MGPASDIRRPTRWRNAGLVASPRTPKSFLDANLCPFTIRTVTPSPRCTDRSADRHIHLHSKKHKQSNTYGNILNKKCMSYINIVIHLQAYFILFLAFGYVWTVRGSPYETKPLLAFHRSARVCQPVSHTGYMIWITIISASHANSLAIMTARSSLGQLLSMWTMLEPLGSTQ